MNRVSMTGAVLRAALLLLVLGAAAPGRTDTSAARHGPFRFASIAEASALLTARDEFVTRLSPFDRAARLHTDRAVDETEYLAFVAANIEEWPGGEMQQRVVQALDFVIARAAALAVPLPADIVLIRTTGKEEAGAAYTRANAIVLPDRMLADGGEDLRRLLSHELFHVLSRADAQRRDALYRVIGFEPCPEFRFPAELEARRITNPDAPRNAHRIRVRFEQRERWAIPVLYAGVDRYDPARGGEFFDYLEFRLALDGGEGEAPRFAAPKEVQGFFEQVGTNTDYIIHPEEILAENFALLVLERGALPAPKIPAALLEVLRRPAGSG